MKSKKMDDNTNPGNEQLVMPDVPDSEKWLFQNPEALAAVKRGLKDAAQGRVEKVDLDEL